MSDATRKKLEASPRRRVRWLYLLNEWPEGATFDDYCEAILAAPADAVIGALTREVDKYSDIIQAERRRADEATAELERLQQALALIFGTVARLAGPLAAGRG